MHLQHKREARAIMGLIIAALIWCVGIAWLGDQSVARTNYPVLTECGKAIGVHDDKPGYLIVQKAEFIQYEDGSGRLVCGKRTVVIVHVPW